MKRIPIIAVIILTTISGSARDVEWALYDVPAGGEFHNGVTAVRTDNGYELMSKNGEIFTNSHFKWIDHDNFEFGYCEAKNANNEVGIINLKGEWILAPSVNYNIYHERKGVFRILDKASDKRALFANGHLISPFEYKFINGSYPFFACEDEYGLDEVINVKTEDVIQGVFYTNGNIATIYENGGNYIYYNLPTGERIPAASLQTSTENIAVKVVDKFNFNIIDTKTGNLISPKNYFYNGNIWINNRLIAYSNSEDLSYVYDEYGHEVFTTTGLLYNLGAYMYRSDYIFGSNDTHYYYYTYAGNIIDDAKYIQPLSGFWYYGETKDGEPFVYNASKNRRRKFKAGITSLSEGMLPVSIDDKEYYLDLNTGKTIGPFNVNRLRAFNEGVAVIDESGDERIMDKNGKVLLRFRSCFPNSEYFSIGERFTEDVLSVQTTGDGGGYIYNPLTKNRTYSQTAGGMDFTAQLTQKAEKAFEQGRYSEAKTLYYQIFTLDTSKLWALSSYAACLYNLGFYDEAIEACEMVLSVDPNYSHAENIKKSSEEMIAQIDNDNSYNEFESVANHDSTWDAIIAISGALMNFSQSFYAPMGFSYESDAPMDSSLDVTNSNYQAQYDAWARRAESNYRSLTNLGYSYTKKNGQKGGNSGQGASPTKYTQMKKNLREAQREMRNIRQKARRNGVSIAQSQWETVSVSY